MFRDKNIRNFYILHSLIWVGCNLHHPYEPTFYVGRDLPQRTFGLAFAVMSLASFLTSAYWGRRCDRGKAVHSIAVSAIFYGCAQVIMGRAATEVQVLVARGLAGIFYSGFAAPLIAFISLAAPPAQRQKHLVASASAFTLFCAAGYLAGGLLGAVIGDHIFIVQGIFMAATGGCTLKYLREPEPAKAGGKSKDKANKANRTGTDTQIRLLLADRQLVLLMVITFLSLLFYVCVDNTFNYVLKEQLKLSSVYNGFIKAFIGGAGLILNLTVSLWLNRKGNLKISLAVIFFLLLLQSVVIVLAPGTGCFVAFNICFLSWNALVQPLLQVLVMDGRPDGITGLVTGVYNSAKTMGSVAGSLAAGLAYEISSQAPFILAGIVCLLAFLAAYGSVKKDIRGLL